MILKIPLLLPEVKVQFKTENRNKMLFCVNHELYFSFGQRQIVTDCCQINVGRSSLSSVEALTVSSVELCMTFWQYEISDKERIPKPRLHKFSVKRS